MRNDIWSEELLEQADDEIDRLRSENEDLAERIDELMDEIDELKKHEWTSVNDRLPEDEGYYLVRVYYSDIEHCAFEVYGWYKGSFIYWAGGMELPVGINTHGENIPMKVTHWMPLPEPPEVEDNEAD